MSSDQWNRPAIGDRYVPVEVTRSEVECERLTRELSRQAAEQHPDIVQHLDRPLRLVLEDLGASASGFFEALWMTPEMEMQIRPWFTPHPPPSVPGEWWRGLMYIEGEKHLSVDVDASLPEEHLPYSIALAIQDTVEEAVREPRPRCPLHGHALAPSGTLRGAVWECPDDGKLWWCRMGQYQQALSSD